MRSCLILLLAVVANGLDGDVVLLQRGTGESFTVHDLSAQHDQEALQDQAEAQAQMQESQASMREMQLAKEEIASENEARLIAKNAEGEMLRRTRTAKAEEASKISLAQEKFAQSMSEAKLQLSRQTTRVKEQQNRDELDVIKNKHEKLTRAVNHWLSEATQVRATTNEAFRRADTQYTQEVSTADQLRSNKIATINEESEAKLRAAAGTAQQTQTEIEQKVSEGLANNLRAKAAKISNLALSAPAATMANPMAAMNPSAATSSSPFASRTLLGQEEPLEEEPDVPEINREKEMAADRQEQQTIERVDRSKQKVRVSAELAFKDAEVEAAETLAASKSAAQQELLKSRAEAGVSVVQEKNTASAGLKEAYQEAANDMRDSEREIVQRRDNKLKAVEKKRDAAVAQAKAKLDKKLEAVENMRKATLPEGTTSTEPAKLESLVTLIQLDPDAAESQAVSISPEMSAEEISRKNQELADADKESADRWIGQFERDRDQALQAQQLSSVQAQEGDESAVIEAEQQKSVQAAATLEQQQLARASGDRAAEEEHDTKRFRGKQQQMASKMSGEKLEESQRKEKLYAEATQEWEMRKHQARDTELSRFKEIEEEQKKELLAAHDMKESALKAAAVDRDAKKDAATKARKEAMAAAEIEKNKAIAAARAAKAMMLKQVSAETEGGSISELTIDDAAEDADPMDELENDDDDMEADAPIV